MDKRLEQIQPDSDSIRPELPPDEGKKSAADFSQHLAALLRAEKHTQENVEKRTPHSSAFPPPEEDAARPGPPWAAQADPDRSEALPDDLEAELAVLLDTPPALHTQSSPDSQPAAPDVDGSALPHPAQDRTEAAPAAPAPESAAPGKPLLQPARMELTPSAQEIREPLPAALPAQEPSDSETLQLRADLSDKPFVPPEADPSLAEIFHLSPEEALASSAAAAELAAPDTPEPPSESAETACEAWDTPELRALLAEAEAFAAAKAEALVNAETLAETERPGPRTREPTGPLPTLDELFGPDEAPSLPEAASTPAPAEPEPPSAPPSKRPGRLRNLLRSLFAPETASEFAEECDFSDEPNRAEAAQPAPADRVAERAPEALAVPLEDAPPVPHPSTAPPQEIAAEPLPVEAEPAAASDFADNLPALEQIFGQAPDSTSVRETEVTTEPEAAPEPDVILKPEVIPQPFSASRPASDSENRDAPPQRKKHRKRSNRFLRLEELLDTVMPIQEDAPPQVPPAAPFVPPTPAAQPPRRKKHAPAASRAAASAAATAAAARKKQADDRMAESFSAMEAALAEPARPVPKPPAQSAGRKEAAWAATLEAEERSGDPVPSADVRKQTRAGRRAEADARRAPKAETLPPEEPPVLHPEAAYRHYAKPLDMIGSRLILTGMFTLLSLFFTLYQSLRWSFLPEVFSGGVTAYIQLGLLIMLVMTNRKPLFHKQARSSGSRAALLLGFSAFFTAADCFRAAAELRSPFTVVFGALTMFFLWGEYSRGLAMTTTIKVLRADKLASGVSEVPEIGKGGRGLVRTGPDTDRFMKKLETRDLTAQAMRVYVPTAVFCGLALTLLIGFVLKRDIFWTGTLIFLGSVPISGLLAFPRLFLQLSRRLAEADAALCGYHGAQVFGGDHAILIGDEDLFPVGSLTLNGFKVYNSNPDRIIAYAAAAARASASALDAVFDDLLVTHNGRQYDVDSFRFYDSGGIGASIGEDVVLMGSLDFMRRMGVHMDKGAKVKQAVYLSLNGELAAVFAIRYAPPDNLRKGLASIAANRHFKGILVTRTFLGTPGFLKAKFGIPAETFHYPATAERIRLSEAELKRTGAQGAILARDSFAGFAQAVAAGRMLRSTTLGAAILTVLNGITGLLLMGVLAFLPAPETATALNLLLYSVIWLAPALLLTVWGRHF